MQRSKIIHYNIFRYDELKAAGMLPGLLANIKFPALMGFLWDIKRRFSYLDRTGSVEMPFQTKIIHPIPEMGTFNKTLDQVADERAAEIWRAANGRIIDVFWSGGVDSTLALAALLKNAPARKKDQLRVRYRRIGDMPSFDEYPLFWETFIDGKVAHQEVPPAQFSDGILFDTQAVSITGELGDIIFRSLSEWRRGKKFGFPPGKSDLSFPAEECVDAVVKSLSYDKTTALSLQDQLSSVYSKCPYDIKSAGQMLWWLLFTMRWTSILGRLTLSLDVVPFKNDVYSFYESDDFQRWAIKAHFEDSEGYYAQSADPHGYKREAKKYIFDFTQDPDYYDSKGKYNSMSIPHTHDLFVLEDGTYLSFDQDHSFDGFEYLINV